HTEQGGKVMITVKTTDKKVIVVVTDNGCGIPKAELSQIFNRFYRIDKSRTTTSSGLGLAITKRILELHGSTINVTSRVNHGTTFSFQIPAYKQ
ncbi:MAG: sensor histidine kinase, partial [Thioalkalispiraceae bacterium]